MMPSEPSPYRGSVKHKRRLGQGRKGSLCPEWTHETPGRGLGSDPVAHRWTETQAHALFARSLDDPEGSGKRYATARGMAFVARDSGDGTWHGYPEPWSRVPADLKDRWLEEGLVTGRQLRAYNDFPPKDIRWAMESDDE